MSTLSFLIPVTILGTIAWAVVGFTRGRGGEPLTLATGASFYARVILIAGVLLGLSGIAVLFKAGFGAIDPSFSYYAQPDFGKLPPGAVPPGALSGAAATAAQRGQDVVLGVTLLAIGAGVAATHLLLARVVGRMPGGSQPWITRGTTLALTVATALGGIPAAAFGLYSLLAYFLIHNPAMPQAWGDPVGAAIAFLPAWVYSTSRLLADLRNHGRGAAQVPALTA